MINVPIAQAATFKQNMQVGILVKLREPYSVTGSGKSLADITLSNPVEENITINGLLADMACAVIADGEGRVVKTVSVGYR